MFSGIVPFKAEHALFLSRQSGNKNIREWFSSGLVYHLENSESFTFFYKDLVCVCGGINPYWEGRGQIWSVFSTEIGSNFVPTFRAVKGWLSSQLKNNYRRIELSVDCDFPSGRRRAELLGFTLECSLAKKYLPSGKDCSIYSLVRGD